MRIGRVLNNLGEKAKLSRNIRRVENMLGECFYTEAQKLDNGGFIVKAFRPVSDYYSSRDLERMSVYTVAQKAMTREGTPSCVVKYDPTTGLETTVRGKGELSDVFYRVTQKIGEEPVVDESVLENADPSLLKSIQKGLNEVKKAVGRFIPTLRSIK